MHHPTDRIAHTTYTSRGALAGTRNSSMGPPNEGSIRRPIAPWANALTTELHLTPTTHRTMSERSYHGATSRSHDPSHHERTLLPRSYISFPRPIAPWANALTTELHLAPHQTGAYTIRRRGRPVEKGNVLSWIAGAELYLIKEEGS